MMFGWIVLVPVIIWLATTFDRSERSARDAAPSPLQILEERFARGEIDADEYRVRRAAIDERRPAGVAAGRSQ